MKDNIWEDPKRYSPDSISKSLMSEAGSYSDSLQRIKLKTLKNILPQGLVVDLGCADGRHLRELSNQYTFGVGIDSSLQFLRYGNGKLNGDENFSLIAADLSQIPIASASVDLVYSFNTLYYLQNIGDVYQEISRILKPSGVAIIEVGNCRSLSTLIASSTENVAQHASVNYSEHLNLMAIANLKVRSIRSFQILPMWGRLPHFDWLIRSNFLERTMMGSLKGKSVDERVSSFRLLRKHAFRHLVYCGLE